MYQFLSHYSKMRHNIVQLSKKYFKEHGIAALVLGISGGVDSALVAALMYETGVPLIGVLLPLVGNKPDEITRADSVAHAFCANVVNIDLDASVQAMTGICSLNLSVETFNRLIRAGNIKARMRMIYLYDRAKALGGLVLSTDNFTEYMLGFWTLHGDVGDFGPIQSLWKTEVYGLTRHLVNYYMGEGRDTKAKVLDECINAVPTDGLGITESDFDQLLPQHDSFHTPLQKYMVIDHLLIAYLNGDETNKDHSVIQRHLSSEFKRRVPVSISRDGVNRDGIR